MTGDPAGRLLADLYADDERITNRRVIAVFAVMFVVVAVLYRAGWFR